MNEDSSIVGQAGGVIRRTSATSGTVAFIFGFISDVLQPLAPIAQYVLMGSVIAVVVLLLLSALARGIRSWGLPLALFSLFMGVFSGILVFLQKGEAAETGVLADKIPALEGIQQTLGIMQKDVEKIAVTTEKIDVKTDKILASVENMSESFSQLAKQGGVIANPETPEEHYHNARIHELGGDYGAARRSYLAFFNSDLDYLDPHLRFQDFLKLQEGRAGARESYQLIANQSKSMVPKYAMILLWDREQRISMLEQFMAANPDFAPGYYHWSLEYSQVRLGTQSLEDKRKEKEYLEKFQALNEEGKFLKWFIDKEMAAGWIADAEARLTLVNKTVASEVLENPVEMRWMHTNSGWMGSVIIAEPTLEIFWRKAGEGDFKSTGHTPMRHPTTGQPMPNMTITLPNNTPNTDIEVKYTNGSGVEMGPFTLPFNPGDSSMTESKYILEITKNSWVAFRDWDGKLLLYFSHLMTHRGILEKIEYGVNKDTPDTEFAFPAYDKPGNADIGTDVPIYTDIPMDSTYVTVQLTFKDGTKTEVVRFDR